MCIYLCLHLFPGFSKVKIDSSTCHIFGGRVKRITFTNFEKFLIKDPQAIKQVWNCMLTGQSTRPCENVV